MSSVFLFGMNRIRILASFVHLLASTSSLQAVRGRDGSIAAQLTHIACQQVNLLPQLSINIKAYTDAVLERIGVREETQWLIKTGQMIITLNSLTVSIALKWRHRIYKRWRPSQRTPSSPSFLKMPRKPTIVASFHPQLQVHCRRCDFEVTEKWEPYSSTSATNSASPNAGKLGRRARNFKYQRAMNHCQGHHGCRAVKNGRWKIKARTGPNRANKI